METNVLHDQQYIFGVRSLLIAKKVLMNSDLPMQLAISRQHLCSECKCRNNTHSTYSGIKYPIKPISRIFHISKIHKMMTFRNLFMGRLS